ncbi:hypothetical protein NW761_014628 [Fusarium oxysporum]|nr:hypothetical protein NW758_003723 [Fusarium oxysporum]KAJ4072800.1 hypothetical protein NW761_014628 [Fusarium oxysporum]
MIKIKRPPPNSNTGSRPSKRPKTTPTHHSSHAPRPSTSPDHPPAINDSTAARLRQSSPSESEPSKPAKSPKSPPPSFTEVNSLRKQAESYRLAIAELPIHLLDSSWSHRSNRPLDHNHIAHLCHSFQNGSLAHQA